MNIHFYNVPPHPASYVLDVPNLSKPRIIAAFIDAINTDYLDLDVDFDARGRRGRLVLKRGRIVAFFELL